MLPKILSVLFILLLCAFFALWDIINTPQKIPSTISPQIKELSLSIKPFNFKTLDGKIISTNTYSGKIIVLNFWASWCTPCAIEFPDLIALTKEYPNDLVFLALSVDEDINNASQFVKKFPPQSNRVLGLDSDKSIAHDIFQTTMFPETYILDRKGIIRRHIIGIADWRGEEIKQDLEKLLLQ